jgi:hypothetical protein
MIHRIDTDGTDHCRTCGVAIAACCDGGSWVHVDTSPDRIVSSSYWGGQWQETRLANGVVWRRKPHAHWYSRRSGNDLICDCGLTFNTRTGDVS